VCQARNPKEFKADMLRRGIAVEEVSAALQEELLALEEKRAQAAKAARAAVRAVAKAARAVAREAEAKAEKESIALGVLRFLKLRRGSAQVGTTSERMFEEGEAATATEKTLAREAVLRDAEKSPRLSARLSRLTAKLEERSAREEGSARTDRVSSSHQFTQSGVGDEENSIGVNAMEDMTPPAQTPRNPAAEIPPETDPAEAEAAARAEAATKETLAAAQRRRGGGVVPTSEEEAKSAEGAVSTPRAPAKTSTIVGALKFFRPWSATVRTSSEEKSKGEALIAGTATPRLRTRLDERSAEQEKRGAGVNSRPHSAPSTRHNEVVNVNDIGPASERGEELPALTPVEAFVTEEGSSLEKTPRFFESTDSYSEGSSARAGEAGVLRAEAPTATEEISEEFLITPCYCSGTLRYVHQKCLQQWLKSNGMSI
jgi:hypothetical protein